jgi:acetyl esterase/lipase
MRPCVMSDVWRGTAAIFAAIMIAAAAVHDVKAAVRWLRAHAADHRIDPARIGALGTSAGGSLAQLLGVTAHVPQFEGTGGNPEQPSDVACVVNIYGANDFTKSYGRSKDAHEVLPLWFGGDLSTHRARHIEGSPLFWVTPAAGHGFKGADATRAEQAIFTFFDIHLKPTASHE